MSLNKTALLANLPWQSLLLNGALFFLMLWVIAPFSSALFFLILFYGAVLLTEAQKNGTLGERWSPGRSAPWLPLAAAYLMALVLLLLARLVPPLAPLYAALAFILSVATNQLNAGDENRAAPPVGLLSDLERTWLVAAVLLIAGAWLPTFTALGIGTLSALAAAAVVSAYSQKGAGVISRGAIWLQLTDKLGALGCAALLFALAAAIGSIIGFWSSGAALAAGAALVAVLAGTQMLWLLAALLLAVLALTVEPGTHQLTLLIAVALQGPGGPVVLAALEARLAVLFCGALSAVVALAALAVAAASEPNQRSPEGAKGSYRWFQWRPPRMDQGAPSGRDLGISVALALSVLLSLGSQWVRLEVVGLPWLLLGVLVGAWAALIWLNSYYWLGERSSRESVQPTGDLRFNLLADYLLNGLRLSFIPLLMVLFSHLSGIAAAAAILLGFLSRILGSEHVTVRGEGERPGADKSYIPVLSKGALLFSAFLLYLLVYYNR